MHGHHDMPFVPLMLMPIGIRTEGLSQSITNRLATGSCTHIIWLVWLNKDKA
jgi:hypothetical protein